MAATWPVHSATPLAEIVVIPDVTGKAPFVDGGFFVSSNTSLLRFDPTSGEVTDGEIIIGDSGAESNPVAVDAYDAASGWFSIDIQAEVSIPSSSFFMRPGEIFDESGTPQFDPTVAGLPQQVDIDAISRDPATGDLLFSIDQSLNNVSPSAPFIVPADVFRWDGADLSLVFNGFMVPRSVNLDGLEVLDNQHMLMSFDVPGITNDGIAFDDNDVLEFDPDSNSFEQVFDTPLSVGDGGHAAVGALSATRAPMGGTVQFETGIAEVMEDAGSVSLTITRTGGAEGESTFDLGTSDGTAIKGSDFNAVTPDFVHWPAGDDTPRTVEIPIIDDTTAESATEHFSVFLVADGATATPGTPTTVNVTIFDNETVLFADGFEGTP